MKMKQNRNIKTPKKLIKMTKSLKIEIKLKLNYYKYQMKNLKTKQ